MMHSYDYARRLIGKMHMHDDGVAGALETADCSKKLRVIDNCKR